MKCRFLVLSAVWIVATACSTDPYSFEYKPVQDQSYIETTPTTSADSATVIARREPSYFGAYDLTRFTLDGVPVVRLRAGEQHRFLVTPGQHIVGSLCEGLSRRNNEATLIAESGRTYFFRIYSGNGDFCQLAPMSR